MFSHLISRSAKKGVRVRIVAPKINRKIPELVEFKKFEKFDSRFFLVDDKQLFFMLTKDDVHSKSDVGIWVNSPYFVNAMSTMFDSAWKNKK